MPLRKTETLSAVDLYGSPFVGPAGDHTHQVLVDLSTLTADEVDADGYLKPGVPIQLPGSVGAAGATGARVTAADQRAGITIEAIKVTEGNADLATDPDVTVAIAFQCAINRAIVEDNLGRALTAAEVTALRAGNVEVLE